MANARVRDFFAQVHVAEGFKPQTMTENTFINAKVFDRIDHHGAQILVPVAFTTAGGAAGAAAVVEVEVASDASATGAFADVLDTVELPVVVGNNNGAHSALAVLPVKLLAAKQFVRVRARIKKTGTVTLSALSGACTIELAQNFSNPSEAYDKTGYILETQAG
jgi:hypothetical protein